MILLNINEAYFGKSSDLKKIEMQLDRFRNKYMGTVYNTWDISEDNDLLQFNRMMEQFFNMDVFSLHIINSPHPNAYTIPIDVIVTKDPQPVYADKTTFKFRKNAGVVIMVNISSAIIFNDDFTTEEVMAIIMHELGHNYYAALNKRFGVFNYFFNAIVFWTNLFTTMAISPDTIYRLGIDKAYVEYEQKMKRSGEISMFISLVQFAENVINFFKTIVTSASKLLSRLSLGLLDVPLSVVVIAVSALGTANSPLTLLLFGLPYNNEKTADNFATMHGYGPALSTALPKLKHASLSKIDKTLDKIPILSNIYNINTQIASIIISPIDEHPTVLARMDDQLALLKYEVNKGGIDPKMRDALLKDINRCQKAIDELITLENGAADKDAVEKIYSKFLYKYCNSKELKDFIYTDRHRFKGYDQIASVKYV